MRHSKFLKVRALLAAGMTKFERRLNRRLIDQLFEEFATHSKRIVLDRRRAANRIPRHARRKWREEQELDRRRPENTPVRLLADFLRLEAERLLQQLRQMFARNAEFRKAYGRVVNADEQNRLLLDYACELSGSRKDRWGDRRALSRWMADDALNERYQWKAGELELKLTFILERLGGVTDRILRIVKDKSNIADTWQRLGVDSLMRESLSYMGDGRVRIAAFQSLSACLASIPPNGASTMLSVDLQVAIQRATTDRRGDVWLQCAAIDLLEKTATDLFEATIVRRLTGRCHVKNIVEDLTREPDDLFVRRHCIRIAARRDLGFIVDAEFWDSLFADRSDAVRQQLAESIWCLPGEIAMERIQRACQDRSPPVRAQAIIGSLQYVDCPEKGLPFLRCLGARLKVEQDLFVQRVLIHVAGAWITEWRRRQQQDDLKQASFQLELATQAYQSWVLPELRRIQADAPETTSRRWAVAAIEQIWAKLDPRIDQLANDLRAYLIRLRPGQTVRIPESLVKRESAERLGRTLAVLTQADFGVELNRGPVGYRLSRPPFFGFRVWRAWFEFWRPATDKRQAHRHTIGRIARGTVRVPSRVLGEISETKVPGEPLVIGSDGTWRPFLPLPDDFVSTLNQNWLARRPTEIYSSEGVTRIDAPHGFAKRLKAAIRLATNLPRLAALRNWQQDGAGDPKAYLTAMNEYGFHVRFKEHETNDATTQRTVATNGSDHAQSTRDTAKPIVEMSPTADPSVTQFFPALLAVVDYSRLAPIWDTVTDYAYYFGSAFENTLTQLVAFAAAALAGFLGLHLVRNIRIANARHTVPISIGGWGTRGKSGTERLKAALLCATGHGVVSKTTGCEAMFIHAPAMGDPLEIPLYRPGDKATIWEQSNLLNLTRGLRPSVFLWECMALTPDYVDVLQRQWMKDDLATITNTYPDHEDLQGPSGYDVATTIAGFVPTNAHVLTSERQMVPLLQDACDRANSTLRIIGWIESGLVTDDLLERFPYREHPDNIALVCAMAEELGIPNDYSMKAMADFLIPDLGVLKTHPPAEVGHAVIEFTNGMSANERYGALGNWTRLGFDRHDPQQDPSTWISTVINNRADRVARSRIFASMIVNDVYADRHFLIGGNLKGLQGFVWEAWDEHAHSLSLSRANQWDGEVALRRLMNAAVKHRIVADLDALKSRLIPMLSRSLEDEQNSLIETQLAQCLEDPELLASELARNGVDHKVVQRLRRHHEMLLKDVRQFETLRQQVLATTDAESGKALDKPYREMLKRWFERKLVIIENYDATGDEVIQRIVDETPAGYLNRVIGMQNIKGTGLDFVYRFHAWDTCHQACTLLESTDHGSRQIGLDLLSGLPEFGLLCRNRIRKTLKALRDVVPPVTAELQIQLESVQKKLADNEPILDSQEAVPGESSSSWVNRAGPAWVIEKVEEWLEVHDALRRRSRADAIYRDLRFARIGRARAIQELRKLNKRQKGGWLATRIAGRSATPS